MEINRYSENENIVQPVEPIPELDLDPKRERFDKRHENTDEQDREALIHVNKVKDATNSVPDASNDVLREELQKKINESRLRI